MVLLSFFYKAAREANEVALNLNPLALFERKVEGVLDDTPGCPIDCHGDCEFCANH